MANPEIVFQANANAGALFAAALQGGLDRALKDGERMLKVWVEEYKRRVQRVTPVDKGLARQSWFTTFERTRTAMIATLANRIKSKDGAPYPVYLEFGTDRIAGGRVKAWQAGEPPILDWPAKTGDLPDITSAMPGSKKYERHADIITNAFTAGSGEQMPMLRPIGYEIAPQVAEDVGNAIAHSFQQAVAHRKAS